MAKRGIFRSDEPQHQQPAEDNSADDAGYHQEDDGAATTESMSLGEQLNGNGEHGDTSKKGKKKTDDEKRADFSRLASLRASNAIEAIRLLGHLANTSQYAWEEEQEAKIIATITAKLAELQDRFAEARKPPPPGAKKNRQLALRV